MGVWETRVQFEHFSFANLNLPDNMGKPGSSHFRDPPLISEESPLKSEAVLIKYLDFWDR